MDEDNLIGGLSMKTAIFMDNNKNFDYLSMETGVFMDKSKKEHYDTGKRNRKVVWRSQGPEGD